MFEFSVNDMTCDHCVSRINEVLKKADATANIEVDLGDHIVRVETKMQADEVEKIIRDAGYTPKFIAQAS